MTMSMQYNSYENNSNNENLHSHNQIDCIKLPSEQFDVNVDNNFKLVVVIFLFIDVYAHSL